MKKENTTRVDVFGDERAILCPGDCLAILPTLAAGSVDAIVTDPPYHLTTGKKGGTGPASDNPHSPAGRARATTGFMGKAWDGGDVAHDPAIWREALRVAKPGAHLPAFGGTRTFHRLACAIEDAGWEIRDTVMWVYGSGVPKSLDVSKAIDKEAGAERKVVGVHPEAAKRTANPNWRAKEGRNDAAPRPSNVLTAPATAAARQWAGWGTALKPAWEPIIVARKPLEGTVAENVQKYGTGGLNIDGCRVPGTNRAGGSRMLSAWRKMEGRDDVPTPPWRRGSLKQDIRGGKFHAASGVPLRDIGPQEGSPLGRWPANLIHDGSEEVVGMFPESNRAEGVRVIHRRGAGTGRSKGHDKPGETIDHGDSGSAARFFYCAKASKQDRDEGLEAMPSIHRVHGNKWTDQDYRVARGERTPGRESGPRRNHHPTVKPTALMRYLCRLVTPPGGIVLDPFAGSGSTGKAAALEGFRFVGIEIDPEYLTIAAARIRAAVPPLFAGSLKNKGSSVSHRSPPVARRTKDGGLAGSGGRGELPFSARSRARVAHGPRVVLRSDDRVVSRD